MFINTDSYRMLGLRFQALRNDSIHGNYSRQILIQNKLKALQSYFIETANLFEEQECIV